MIKIDTKAMQKFGQIPDEMKAKILSNVYCSHCKDTVRIVDFEATTDKGDLLEPLANSNHCKQLISSHSNF